MRDTERISVAEYRALIAAGGQTRAKRRASPEEDLQRDCIKLVEALSYHHPILRWLVHVPNGGKRPRGEAGKLRALGTKPGVPDLLLPRRFGQWQGLVVELKAPKGRVTVEQQDWLDAFSDDGYLVAVCRTLPDFEATLYRFLGVH